ncbi:MAG: hypothetical protein E7273_10160 [Pseudobutyrivibrio ruminis]|nr:hypothetical protein [Pseudobutyrivibrio ruminis]
MKAKRILLGVLFCMTTLIFSGCSSTPSEKDIKKDLLNYDGMELFEIDKVTINRELIDNKKDVIDCTVKTSNEYADMEYYLTIDYTKYDTGGWQIDDVQKSKDTAFEIISTPSDQEFTSKCQEYIENLDNVIEFQIDNPIIDIATGTGNISAKVVVEKQDNLFYYRTYNCNISFEDGNWYTYGDETLSDVRYICLNTNNLIGKSFYSDSYRGYYSILINIENITDADDGYELDYSYAYKHTYSDEDSVTGNDQMHLSFDKDTDTYRGVLSVNGDLYHPDVKLCFYDKMVELMGDDMTYWEILQKVNRNDYSAMYNNDSTENQSESIEYVNTELYGDYRLDLNNGENGWCELNISAGTEVEPYIYISAYENGNHETAFFEGFLYEDGDAYNSYCETTEADLKLTIVENGIQISVSNSIYDGDEIMNGTYIKQ